MPIPSDYAERVYAGVLGKLIGVYLGRPFEGWEYDRIVSELGLIQYYVHEQRGMPLIVTDDDISGTFTFIRALPDHGDNPDITAQDIGNTWLNYLIEGRTILWWGGLGNSTEHTAYLRLKEGVSAPRSGSSELNTQVVAEQIGAQIFIDGWGMVNPGNPARAAELAQKAGAVSHDGEALYAAQVIAAMEAQAFVEADIDKLLDCGMSFIPKDSTIYRMNTEIRHWHTEEQDWRRARRRLAAKFGYDKYGGNVHVVPNHGLIILALLYGAGDFQRSLMIVNTCGWDTDCNSGNVGCILGIKDGLRAIDSGPDWRGPVGDRMYISTADGGNAITDAVIQTYKLVNIGRALEGQPSVAPKGGARFNFELPGSIQGWQADNSSPDSRGTTLVENREGHSMEGTCTLAISYDRVAPGRISRAFTDTFIPPVDLQMKGYSLYACPTLYSGQRVRARATRDEQRGEATARLVIAAYGGDDRLKWLDGPELDAGGQEVEWRVPDTGGQPIARIGVEIRADQAASGILYLDYLTWDGAPNITLDRPADGGRVWQRAWVDGVDQWENRVGEPYRVMQNRGRGLLIQGTREWQDYRVSALMNPHMLKACGLGARVQGMRRYYSMMLETAGKVRLVKVVDDKVETLAEADFVWQFDSLYTVALEVRGDKLRGYIDGRQLLEDQDGELEGGAVALIVEEGRLDCSLVRVEPLG